MNRYVKIDTELNDYLQTLKGAPLAVFLCIALHVGKSQTAFPSEKRICRLTGYCERQVRRAIRTLEGNRFITVLERGRNTNGRKLANVYEVCRLASFKRADEMYAAQEIPMKAEGIMSEMSAMLPDMHVRLRRC
jgi:hypothetical protein